MKVILNQDVENLGFKFDVVDVKAGYGRNYLIPQGKAILANEQNLKVYEENMRQRKHKADKILEEAKSVAQRMAESILRIPAKVGENDKIYGSVTSAQISEALNAQGFTIDRKRIKINQEIKTLGTYQASVVIHKELNTEISFEVIAG